MVHDYLVTLGDICFRVFNITWTNTQVGFSTRLRPYYKKADLQRYVRYLFFFFFEYRDIDAHSQLMYKLFKRYWREPEVFHGANSFPDGGGILNVGERLEHVYIEYIFYLVYAMFSVVFVDPLFGQFQIKGPVLYVKEVVTILYSTLLYKMGNYFLDLQYLERGIIFIILLNK